MYKRISITSESTSKVLQTLKDYATPTEKKVLLKMLNQGLDDGTVRNKTFHIRKTPENTANIIIRTTTYSEILRKDETIATKFTIKYS